MYAGDHYAWQDFREQPQSVALGIVPRPLALPHPIACVAQDLLHAKLNTAGTCPSTHRNAHSLINVSNKHVLSRNLSKKHKDPLMLPPD